LACKLILNCCMYKILLTFKFFCFVFLSCKAPAQQQNEIKSIEFNSLSRGGENIIAVFTSDSINITTLERNVLKSSIRKKINPNDWAKLLASLKPVSLSELPNLKSPTMKRAFDGAKHSEIKITNSSNTAFSHNFDDTEPHPLLKQLMFSILELNKNTK
jgi:hypothetical protein